MLTNSSHESTAAGPEQEGPVPPAAERPTSAVLALSRGDCLRLLASHRFGRLAVAMDVPVIRPVNYLFDEPSQSVVFRTSDGSKFQALLGEAQAAFEIDGIDPGTRTGWSVIVAGVAEKVTNPLEIRRLEALGLEDWTPTRKQHWMRIRVRTVSGRRIVLAA